MICSCITDDPSECGVTEETLQNTACIAVVCNVCYSWWEADFFVVKAMSGSTFFLGLFLLDLKRLSLAFLAGGCMTLTLISTRLCEEVSVQHIYIEIHRYHGFALASRVVPRL